MASSNNYKRKMEGSENGGRKTGFSDGPPAMDEVEIAKQRAQEIVARLVNTAEAKRPRIEDESARTGLRLFVFLVSVTFFYLKTSNFLVHGENYWRNSTSLLLTHVTLL
ncbi:hypothetical protein SUGI_0621620 [Cryptomeria japonica]|nr:hypothetical protein SUGI_0621620 [Cryptomeria japonica]